MDIHTIRAELRKIKGSGFLPASFIAFGLAPLMGGVFMLMLRHPSAMARAGGLATKADAMHFTADWVSYFHLLSQAVGVGGVLIFGFVISWLFGREYSDGTAKDMLALPTSRRAIIHGKFAVYILWCLMLATSNLFIGAIIGSMLGIDIPSVSVLLPLLGHYYATVFLTLLTVVPIAFFALWGRGFLTPLGFVALTLVFAQIIAAAGFGSLFPWAIPGLFSGASGDAGTGLGIISYVVVLLTAFAGYGITTSFWIHADHTK